jgi:hypothetical protein
MSATRDATTVTGLVIPVITNDMSRLDAALAYANAGWYIGPEKRKTKNPGSILGKDWQRRTSRDTQVIAAWFAGTDHGIFLHVGRSGAWVPDVDDPEKLHPAIQLAIRECDPPFQSTRAGQPGRGHYIFRQPEGRMLGNSLSNLERGWGEGRGLNGVIIVAPSEHEKPEGCYQWRRTGPVPAMPGYMASQLPDVMEAAEAATDEQVEAFLAEHTSHTRPDLLDVHCASFKKKVAAGDSRHQSVLGHISGAMKEAKAGLLDAKTAADTMESVFLEAVAKTPVGPKQGRARNGAVARNEWGGLLSWAVAQGLASDPTETHERINQKVPKDPFEGLYTPNGSTQNGSHPPPQDAATGSTDWEKDFWTSREVLERFQDFARSRRVGPWAMLGCVLVRVIAATTTRLVLPPLAGGQVSLNLFTGIVGFTGGGKGTAESASRGAIELPHVDVVGPGSGEGIGHLFKAWDNKEKTYFQYRDAVIISAAEVSTLNALRARQSSTLFRELNKAWMGEPLGFAYVAKEKSLNLKPHSYRLCLITGIQPANANVILNDVDSGSPARYLWMPTSDPGAHVVRPDDPGPWRGWSLAKSFGAPERRDPTALQPLDVCQEARDAVDNAALDRLHEVATDPLDSHKLLSRLKTAAALALLESRAGVITEEDWQLAGVVHDVSDLTRERMIHVLRDKVQAAGTARAIEDGRREHIKESVVEENGIWRTCQVIKSKLGPDWVSASNIRKTLASTQRRLFDPAVERLRDAGDVEVEEIDYQGQPGRRLRLTRQARS